MSSSGRLRTWYSKKRCQTNKTYQGFKVLRILIHKINNQNYQTSNHCIVIYCWRIPYGSIHGQQTFLNPNDPSQKIFETKNHLTLSPATFRNQSRTNESELADRRSETPANTSTHTASVNTKSPLYRTSMEVTAGLCTSSVFSHSLFREIKCF